MLRRSCSKFCFTKVACDIGGTTAKFAVLLPTVQAHLLDVLCSDKVRVVDAASAVVPLACSELLLRHKGTQQEEGSIMLRTPEKMSLKFLQCSSEDASDFLLRHLAPTEPLGKLICATSKSERTIVSGTGGGAFKYREAARGMDVDLNVNSELGMLVEGVASIASFATNELLFRMDDLGNRAPPSLIRADRYHSEVGENRISHFDPFLLVNVGSGISFLKVKVSEDHHHYSFERVGGSSVGGATFWGLSKSICHVNSWQDLEHLFDEEAVSGKQSSDVDLTVGDIYGSDPSQWGGGLPPNLPPDTLAASFGKIGSSKRSRIDRKIDFTSSAAAAAAASSRSSSQGTFKSADVLHSLVTMLSYNTTQLASLYMRLHGLDNAIFSGGFVSGKNNLVQQHFETSMRYWTESEGKTPCHFVRGSAYVGALGALIN